MQSDIKLLPKYNKSDDRNDDTQLPEQPDSENQNEIELLS